MTEIPSFVIWKIYKVKNCKKIGNKWQKFRALSSCFSRGFFKGSLRIFVHFLYDFKLLDCESNGYKLRLWLFDHQKAKPCYVLGFAWLKTGFDYVGWIGSMFQLVNAQIYDIYGVFWWICGIRNKFHGLFLDGLRWPKFWAMKPQGFSYFIC